MQKLKACPFCGTLLSIEDEDTIYPSGVYWRFSPEYGEKQYILAKELSKEDLEQSYNKCWKINCRSCDAEMHGDDKQETINKWNNRV